MDVLRFLTLMIIVVVTMPVWLPLAIGLYLYDRFFDTHYFNYMQ